MTTTHASRSVQGGIALQREREASNAIGVDSLIMDEFTPVPIEEIEEKNLEIE